MTHLSLDDSESRSLVVVGPTRVLQIIVCSLIVGVLIFAGFLVLTGQLQKRPQGTVLSFVAVGFSALMIVLHVVVPGIIERAALANQAVGSGLPSLIGVFVTRTIIAAAMLDGAAFMSLVALMTEHQPWMIGVTGVLVVLMLMQIPSRTRIEHWIESRMMERGQSSM